MVGAGTPPAWVPGCQAFARPYYHLAGSGARDREEHQLRALLGFVLVFAAQLLLLLLLLLLKLGGALHRALTLALAQGNLTTLELRNHPRGQHRADSLHPIRLTQQQHGRDGAHEPAATCQALFHVDAHVFQALALHICCGDHPLHVHQQLELLELLSLLRTSGHSARQLSGVAMHPGYSLGRA